MAKFKMGSKTIVMKDKITVGEFDEFQTLMNAEEKQEAAEGKMKVATSLKFVHFFVENKEEVSEKEMRDMDMVTFQEVMAHATDLMNPKKKEKTK